MKRKNYLFVSSIITLVFLLVAATIILHSISNRSSEQGEYAYDQGNYDLAIKYYTRAINLNFWDKEKKNYDFYSRGLSYFSLGDFDMAINDLTKAIKLGTDDYWISSYYFYRGLAYQYKLDYDLAISDYNRCLTIVYNPINNDIFDKDDILSISDLVTTQKKSIEKIQMRNILDNALPGTIEHTAEIHFKRGLDFAYIINNNNYLNNAINNRVMQMLSGIYFPGDLNMAIKEWEEALRIYPDHFDAKESLEKALAQKANAQSNLCPISTQITDSRWQKWNAEMKRDITYVEFSGILKYFLFNVDEAAGETNMMKPESFHFALIKDLEQNFIIDYDSMSELKNNIRLSKNVKSLMTKHGANVSVVIRESDNEAVNVTINMNTSHLQEDTYSFISFEVCKKSENL